MKLGAYQQVVGSDVPKVKQSLSRSVWAIFDPAQFDMKILCLLADHNCLSRSIGHIDVSTKLLAYQQAVCSDVPEVKQSLSRSARAIFDPAQFDMKFLCLWLIIIAFRGRLATP